jgi:peptidoglycan/LPS O-acetylase OafA/YrhL
MNSFPWNLLLAIAAAVASYTLLEKPLLRLRRKLRA